MSETAKHSIRGRLGLGYLQSTGVALVVILAAFFVSDVVRSRDSLTREVTVLADVVGVNAGAALTSLDPEAGMSSLRPIQVQPNIVAAGIYTADGRLLVNIQIDDSRTAQLPVELDGVGDAISYPLFSGELELMRGIEVEGERVGTVVLRSKTESLLALAVRFAGIAVGALLAAGAISWLGASRLQSRFSTPLADLVAGSSAMSNGDLSIRVAITSNDEIGEVAAGFNHMVESLSGLVRKVGENTRAVSEATVVLRSAGGGMRSVSGKQEAAVEGSAESIEKISASIEEVNSAVAALADAARESSDTATEMDGSIVTIVAHMDELSHTIDAVSASVVEMTTAIRQIAEHSETLKSATESTASSLDQLSSSVSEVEQNAQLSQSLSRKAASQAEQGLQSVGETVEGMKQIQESFGGLEEITSRLDEQSQSIGEVLSVIESVVEQTNLLALNAAIISSHAGEHGRAFAVVAEEMKSLSDRTAGSTKEIGERIGAVQKEIANAVAGVRDGGKRVERGVSLSLEAGEVLRAMAASAEESNRTANEIVRATGEQTTGLSRVDHAMMQVKEIALHLSRGTHEQDSASAEITRSVERMRQLGQDVRRSTADQRNESRQIAESVESVASRIDRILAATNEQSKEGDQLRAALQVFMEVTVEAGQRAEEMMATVELLSDRTRILDEEVGRFST